MRLREDYRTMTGPEKAALLLMSVGEDNATRLFALMEEDEIRELSQSMATLGNVSAQMVERLLVEFADQISSTFAKPSRTTSRGFMAKKRIARRRPLMTPPTTTKPKRKTRRTPSTWSRLSHMTV